MVPAGAGHGPRQRRAPLLARRAVLQPRAQRRGAARAFARHRAEPRHGRRPLRARLRPRRHGRHGARRRQLAPGHAAQSQLRQGADQPVAGPLLVRPLPGAGGRPRPPSRGGRRRGAGALQPGHRLSAEGAVRGGPARVHPRPGVGRGAGAHAAGHGGGLPSPGQGGAGAGPVRPAPGGGRAQPQAVERARRLPAPVRVHQRRGDQLPARAGDGPRVPAGVEQPGCRAPAPRRPGGLRRVVHGGGAAAAGVHGRVVQPRADVPAPRPPRRRPGCLPRRPARQPRDGGRVERHRRRADGDAALRGGPQRLRPRGGIRPGPRGGALQPLLRPLEPR